MGINGIYSKTLNSTCFGFHCIVISKYLLETIRVTLKWSKNYSIRGYARNLLHTFIPQYDQSNASLINTYLPISQWIEGRVTGRGVVAFSIRLYQNSPTASFWKTTLQVERKRVKSIICNVRKESWNRPLFCKQSLSDKTYTRLPSSVFTNDGWRKCHVICNLLPWMQNDRGLTR